MKLKRSSTVAASIIMCLATSGCNLAPTKEGADNGNTTKSEGALLGAGAGGVIAGVGTYIVTGDAEKATKAAAIGAAVGAAAGYLVGREIYEDQSKFASTERFLDHHIKLVRENNQTVANVNKELEAQIAKFNEEIDALNASYEKGAATRRDLYAQRERVTKQLASQQKNNQQLQLRVANQTRAIDEAEAKQAELANHENVKLADLREENQRFRTAVAQHSQLVEELQTISTSDTLEG